MEKAHSSCREAELQPALNATYTTSIPIPPAVQARKFPFPVQALAQWMQLQQHPSKDSASVVC